MAERTMGEFWDRRAEEDPFYFVDNRLDYRDPDLQAFWTGGERDLSTILERLEVGIDSRDEIVEIGCGVGRITRALARRGGSVQALDVSQRMLEHAREHNPELQNVTWVHGDGYSLAPVADASADVCFSHVVFQHIPDPAITLGYVSEMGRVLRPGGWAAFQVSNLPAIHKPRPIGERLRSLPGRVIGSRPRGQTHGAWLGSAVDLDELTDVAKAADMRLEKVSGAGTQYCLVLLRKQG